MNLTYKSNKLEKQLTFPRERVKAHGQLAKKIGQRIEELVAASSLEVMRSISAARCHELKGDRNGEIAVSVSGNYRLIFCPNHDPIPVNSDGGLNWEAVTAIRILEVEDYH